MYFDFEKFNDNLLSSKYWSIRLHFRTNVSRSVLITIVSSAWSKQCMMPRIGYCIQLFCKKDIRPSIKNMNKRTDDAAPCRMPEVVRNSSDAWEALPMIQDVCNNNNHIYKNSQDAIRATLYESLINVARVLVYQSPNFLMSSLNALSNRFLNELTLGAFTT